MSTTQKNSYRMFATAAGSTPLKACVRHARLANQSLVRAQRRDGRHGFSFWPLRAERDTWMQSARMIKEAAEVAR